MRGGADPALRAPPRETDKVVIPDTFNDDVHVVVLFSLVVPDIYNDVFIDVFK